MQYSYKTMTTRLNELSLWMKVTIILVALAIVRIGSNIPLPFVNREYIQALLDVEGLGFLNAITGGSMLQMSFFALSVSPYITASIIIQLMTVVSPALDEMRKDGKTGMDKYKKITQATGVALALLQAAGMAIGLGSQGLLTPYNPVTVLGATLIWTVGGVFIIFLGEFLDKLELGSGISMILFCNIVASIPSDIRSIYEVFTVSGPVAVQATKMIVFVLVILGVIAACVVCSSALKQLPVVQTRKLTGSAKSTFPIPLMTCSVMPVIFAGSIMSMPILIAQFVPALQSGVAGHIIRTMNTSAWFDPAMPLYSVGAIVYALLTTAFTYFYLEIGFNATEIAENLKKSGAVIPGLRPGKPTEERIRSISTRVALLGNTIMTGIILFMYCVCSLSGLGTLSIAGTSCFICVNVVLEEKKKIESNLSLRMKKARTFLLAGNRIAV